jgi:hypothetical protein
VTFNPRFFNLSTPWWRIGRHHVRLLQVFNRDTTVGHFWGIGVLQIGHRHLLYVGWQGVRVLFLGRTA